MTILLTCNDLQNRNTSASYFFFLSSAMTAGFCA